MFGYTLILAGFARIIEVCFLPASAFGPEPLGDNDTEHTLSPSQTQHIGTRSHTVGIRAFRHLPPFVSLN